MYKSNAVLISFVCLTLLACSSRASPNAQEMHGANASVEVYYRDFDTTSIVNLDVKALKHANDLSYSLTGKPAEDLDAKLHSLGCQVDRDHMQQDLRLLVVYQSGDKSEEWQFSKFFFVTPNGKRCELNDAHRRLLDGIVRSHNPMGKTGKVDENN